MTRCRHHRRRKLLDDLGLWGFPSANLRLQLADLGGKRVAGSAIGQETQREVLCSANDGGSGTCLERAEAAYHDTRMMSRWRPFDARCSGCANASLRNAMNCSWVL